MLKHILFACLITASFPLTIGASIENPYSLSQASVERTLSIIKPDAVADHHIGEIIAQFEKEGLQVVGIKMIQLTRKDALQFYAVHQDRPFYRDLVDFMSSGPVVIMVLEGKNAVAKNRELMGTTNPDTAALGTIRARFASSIQKNAVHGSDSLENAQKEIAFFFTPKEIFGSR